MKTKFKFLATMLIGILLSTNVWGADPVTIYYETFGTSGNKTDISSYSGWSDSQTESIVSTSSWKISKPDAEVCDVTGTSGSCNAYCGSSNGTLIFNFGDLSDSYANVKLSFNWKNGAAKGSARTISCQLSGDGGSTWGSNILTSQTTQDWFSVNDYVISASLLGNFSVKITNTAGNTSRIDDIKLIGTPAQTCTPAGTALAVSASPTSITTDETSTLSTTGGNGGAVSYSVTSANASSASIVGTTFSATAIGTYTVRAHQDMNGDVCEQNATVDIVVTPERHEVRWHVSGVVTTDEVAEGAAITFPADPSAPTACAEKSFYGWAKSAIIGETDDEPTVYTAETMGSADVDFYAVFATAAGGGTVTHTMDVPQDVAISGYSDRSYPDDKGYTWSGKFSGFENAEERFWSLSKNSGNYHISSPTFAGNVSSIKFWVRQTAEDTRTIILRSNTSTAQPSASDMGLTAAVPYDANVQEVTITPTTQEFTQFNIYVSAGFGFRKIQVVTGGGVTYSNYVTSCATYTVTWMSNGFEIRVDENVAPGAALTAPTVSEVRAVSAKAACGDHLVGWVPAASTTNPKVKQDTAPAEMVGQQVTVADNVVYHAVYADVVEE